jgi:hypothetical protein
MTCFPCETNRDKLPAAQGTKSATADFIRGGRQAATKSAGVLPRPAVCTENLIQKRFQYLRSNFPVPE